MGSGRTRKSRLCGVCDRPTADARKPFCSDDCAGRWVCEGCGEARPHKARGLCNRCYLRTQYNGPAERDNRLRRVYGPTADQHDQLHALQGGRCAGCRRTEEEAGRLHVDHCHDSGAVRGLLCGPCNRALGLLRDDAGTLWRLVAYLEQGEGGGPLATS